MNDLAKWVVAEFGSVIDIPFVLNEKDEPVIAFHELKRRVSDRYGAESVQLSDLKGRLRQNQVAALGN